MQEKHLFNGNLSPEAVRRETQITCWATDIKPQNVIIKKGNGIKGCARHNISSRIGRMVLVSPQTLQISFWVSKWLSWYWMWAIALVGNSVLNFPLCICSHLPQVPTEISCSHIHHAGEGWYYRQSEGSGLLLGCKALGLASVYNL